MVTHHVTAAERRRVGTASLVGTALEWYDFYLYSSAAALVFNKIIFVDEDPTVATLLAFATFAIGYLVRPLGGVVFGYIGDRVGRRSVLILTLLVMGLATTLMAFVPTYAQVGVWAPIILVLLRVIQGLGAGAEFGGASIMSVEFAEPNRRGLYGSLPHVGIFLGLLMASGAFSLFTLLPEDQFLTWGWRIPFAASVVMIGVALYIRLKVSESPAFQEAQEGTEASKVKEPSPLAFVLKHEKRGMIAIFGTQMASNTVSYLNLTFLAAYVTGTLGMESSVGPIATAIAAVVTLVTVPLMGILCDRVGRKPVILGGALFSAAFIYPYFWIIESTQTLTGVSVAVTLALGIGVAAMVAPQGSYFAELFTAKSRFTGFAFSRELAGATTGGLTPMIAVALVAAVGGTWLLSMYVIGMCLAGAAIVAFVSPETRRHRLDALTLEELRASSEVPAERGSTTGDYDLSAAK